MKCTAPEKAVDYPQAFNNIKLIMICRGLRENSELVSFFPGKIVPGCCVKLSKSSSGWINSFIITVRKLLIF
jgi:hypothetical protein